MSAAESRPADERDPKLDRLVDYLRERLRERDDPLYVKSKFVAEEVDCSVKELGARFHRLATTECQTDLEVERWSYTNATTWRVTWDQRRGETSAANAGERADSA